MRLRPLGLPDGTKRLMDWGWMWTSHSVGLFRVAEAFRRVALRPGSASRLEAPAGMDGRDRSGSYAVAVLALKLRRYAMGQWGQMLVSEVGR